MECIFCKISSGEIPCYKLYEDAFTLAFLDIAGDVDGHTVVIPKKHVGNVLDCDDETLKQLMSVVKQLSKHFVECCGFQGVNLLNASGAAAQQSVPHFHMHIIPRQTDDRIDAWPCFNGSTRTLEAMHELLKLQ